MTENYSEKCACCGQNKPIVEQRRRERDVCWVCGSDAECSGNMGYLCRKQGCQWSDDEALKEKFREEDPDLGGWGPWG